ncbi:MAG: hypothetical protein ACOYWZ_06595 [Bacillota bacterium]
MTHDEMIERLFIEYQRADKKKYVDLFLSGLSNHRIYLGMAALGYMRNFPKHKYCLLKDWVMGNGQKAIQQQTKLNVLERAVLCFEDLSPDLQSKVVKNSYKGICYPCEICAEHYNIEYPVSEEIKKYWLEHGSLHCGNELFLFWMEYTNSLTLIPEPTKDDFEILQTILNCICSAEANEGIRNVQKKIKQQPFYKLWYSGIREEKKAASESTEYLSTFLEYRIQLILEMFGLCGILHTETKLAPFYEFDNIPMVTRNSHRSNWELPVDFWRGKNGIDKNAFTYWFGSQPYKFTIDT